MVEKRPINLFATAHTITTTTVNNTAMSAVSGLYTVLLHDNQKSTPKHS